MTRRCSHCSHNGHNSRTCPNRGVKLFGVRLTDGSIRKSASMSNLSYYTGSSSGIQNGNGSISPTADHRDGYASEDFVPGSSSSRERKKGVPWTEEEHRMFLLGLQKLGKGDWRGISRNYVISRSPTQVASHAQKYFIRQTNVSRTKRRSTLFGMTADEDLLSHNNVPEETPSNNRSSDHAVMDEEYESMDSTNSNNGESLTYFSPFFPFPFPFWPEYGTDQPNKTETHQVFKPTAVHSKNSINIDELVGMSNLSLGESISSAGRRSSLSKGLIDGSSRQSAFQANPHLRVVQT